MKLLHGIILALTIVLLYLTDVVWNEIYIMVGCLSAFTIVYFLFSKENYTLGQITAGSTVIVFFLSMTISLVDLISNHFKVIREVADGRHLTLGERINEFSDDIFVVAIIVTLSVTLITIIATTIYNKLFRRVDIIKT